MSKPLVTSLDEDEDEVDDEDEADADFADAAIEDCGFEELSDRSNGIYTKSSYARMLTRVSIP